MLLEHDLILISSGFGEEISRQLDIEGRRASPVLAQIRHVIVSHLTESSPRPAVRDQPFQGVDTSRRLQQLLTVINNGSGSFFPCLALRSIAIALRSREHCE